jgi:hypothetical protein
LNENLIILKEYSEHVFDSLDKTLKGLKPSEIHWRPNDESDDIYQILRHVSRISVVFLPEVIKGSTKSDWTDDYENKHYSLNELLRDLEAGREMTVNSLSSLQLSDLDVEIPIWKGTHRRKEAIFTLLGELMHHEGQIAYIRTTLKRLQEKDLLPTSSSLG